MVMATAGKHDVTCFLDAAGTGQPAQSGSYVTLNTEIARINVIRAAPSGRSDHIRQKTDAETTDVSGWQCDQNVFVCIESGTFDPQHPGNSAFSLLIDASLEGVDDVIAANNIEMGITQNLHNFDPSGSYVPGDDITWFFGMPSHEYKMAPLSCPGDTFNRIAAPYSILDSNRVADGGSSISPPEVFRITIDGHVRHLKFWDSPGTQHYLVQPCDRSAALISTAGGFAFTTYLVAYSTQAPHSYAVIGKADWTMKFIGSVSSGPVWNKSPESIVNASQFVEDGFPLSGAAAGIEVNGPNGLQLYGKKNGK